jgi:hypothetical protein
MLIRIFAFTIQNIYISTFSLCKILSVQICFCLHRIAVPKFFRFTKSKCLASWCEQWVCLLGSRLRSWLKPALGACVLCTLWTLVYYSMTAPHYHVISTRNFTHDSDSESSRLGFISLTAFRQHLRGKPV